MHRSPPCAGAADVQGSSADLATGRWKMKGIVWHGPKEMSVEEVPEPKAEPGTVIVRPTATGICASEIEEFLGRMGNRTPPLAMGHKFAGTVTEVGDGAESKLLALTAGPAAGGGTRGAADEAVPARSVDCIGAVDPVEGRRPGGQGEDSRSCSPTRRPSSSMFRRRSSRQRCGSHVSTTLWAGLQGHHPADLRPRQPLRPLRAKHGRHLPLGNEAPAR